jgi:hypothetical protein
MAQYCSIQEAYNVPTFPKKKKGPMTKMNAEPYDIYTEQRGREKAMYEGFEGETTAAAPTKNAASQSMMGGSSVNYRSQLTDYDYICKTAGICPLGEKFDNYETVSSPPAGPMKPQNPVQACSPLEPPPYEYPLSDGDKDRFRKALNVAIEQMEGNGPAPAYVPRTLETRKVNMDEVSGYVDEELESYMTITDMKPIAPKTSEPIPDNRLKDVSGTVKKEYASATPFVQELQKVNLPENFTKKNKIWMDLLLFVASGILIIFLLEQLFKLAMITGMKKTVEAMEMILHETRPGAPVYEGYD